MVLFGLNKRVNKVFGQLKFHQAPQNGGKIVRKIVKHAPPPPITYIFGLRKYIFETWSGCVNTVR